MKPDPTRRERTGSGRRRLFYLLYAGFWVCFFAYRLFPSAQVAAFLSDRLGAAAPEYSLVIDALAPAFPPALKARGVSLHHRLEELIRLDEVRVAPRLEGILRLRPAVSFKGRACGGSFEGRTEVEPLDPGQRIRLHLAFSGIALEAVPRLAALTGHALAGMLEGRAVVTAGGPAPREMTAALVLAGAVIDPPAPVLAVRRLRFDRVAADIAFSQGKLSILEGRFNGPQMDGSISGTIAVERPLTASRLDLRGAVRPHAEFLAKLEEPLPVPSNLRKAIAESGLSFRFSGTYGTPAVALAPGSAGRPL